MPYDAVAGTFILVCAAVLAVSVTVAGVPWEVLGAALGAPVGFRNGLADGRQIADDLRAEGRALRTWRTPHPAYAVLEWTAFAGVCLATVLAALGVLPPPLAIPAAFLGLFYLAVEWGTSCVLRARELRRFEAASGQRVQVSREAAEGHINGFAYRVRPPEEAKGDAGAVR